MLGLRLFLSGWDILVRLGLLFWVQIYNIHPGYRFIISSAALLRALLLSAAVCYCPLLAVAILASFINYSVNRGLARLSGPALQLVRAVCYLLFITRAARCAGPARLMLQLLINIIKL